MVQTRSMVALASASASASPSTQSERRATATATPHTPELRFMPMPQSSRLYLAGLELFRQQQRIPISVQQAMKMHGFCEADRDNTELRQKVLLERGKIVRQREEARETVKRVEERFYKRKLENAARILRCAKDTNPRCTEQEAMRMAGIPADGCKNHHLISKVKFHTRRMILTGERAMAPWMPPAEIDIDTASTTTMSSSASSASSISVLTNPNDFDRNDDTNSIISSRCKSNSNDSKTYSNSSCNESRSYSYSYSNRKRKRRSAPTTTPNSLCREKHGPSGVARRLGFVR